MSANNTTVTAAVQTKTAADKPKSPTIAATAAASPKPLLLSAAAKPAPSAEYLEKKAKVSANFAQQGNFEAYIKDLIQWVPAHDKPLFDECVAEERARRKDPNYKAPVDPKEPLISSMAEALEGAFLGKTAYSVLCQRLDAGACNVASLSRKIAEKAVDSLLAIDEEGDVQKQMIDAMNGAASSQLLIYAKDEIGPIGNLFNALVGDLVLTINGVVSQSGQNQNKPSNK